MKTKTFGFLPLLILAALSFGPAARPLAVMAAPPVTLAQDDHGHEHEEAPAGMPMAEGPAFGNTDPLGNVLVPVLMIVGGLVYVAFTRRRPRRRSA